ncbi:hypothetical protein [Miltoncostaea oceani]|uniref:hypothetical protein n=1 Tax=Miltoncostaea oceani TaxID=2843216 RepID=UPI001C3CD84C|nr:hypothetical protein [Miltoncostaea oceani]
MTTHGVPTRNPAPGRDARDGGWADAARRERRLQALQTTILIGLSLLVAVTPRSRWPPPSEAGGRPRAPSPGRARR